jgi:hypothetical protein
MNEFKLIDDVMPNVSDLDRDGLATARARIERGREARRFWTLRWAGFLPAVATVAVISGVIVALGVVPQMGGESAQNAVAIPLSTPSVVFSGAQGEVKTAVEGPPEKMVAAGRLAVSAYWTTRVLPVSGDIREIRRTWHLLDPVKETYWQTPWQWLDVAPGLRLAAVLEGDLPSRRLGILDTTTRQVLTWLDLEHPVGGLAWSPDGTKILATAYQGHPDLRSQDEKSDDILMAVPSTRTGFTMIDVATQQARYTSLPALPSSRVEIEGRVEIEESDGPKNNSSRQDFGWSVDGSLIWGPTHSMPDKVFYDLNGRPHATPAEPYMPYEKEGTVSPDGRLEFAAGTGDVRERATKKVFGKPDILQFLGWADNDRFVAVGCPQRCTFEHRNGLILVSADGSEKTPLSGNRQNDEVGRWEWLLTRR